MNFSLFFLESLAYSILQKKINTVKYTYKILHTHGGKLFSLNHWFLFVNNPNFVRNGSDYVMQYSKNNWNKSPICGPIFCFSSKRTAIKEARQRDIYGLKIFKCEYEPYQGEQVSRIVSLAYLSDYPLRDFWERKIFNRPPHYSWSVPENTVLASKIKLIEEIKLNYENT